MATLSWRQPVPTASTWALFAVVALGVTLAWSHWAKTEKITAAQPHLRHYARLQNVADGTATPPFLKRRLLVDSARVLAVVMPAPVWDGIADTIRAVPKAERMLVTHWGWEDDDAWPLLLSATFLIWASAVGYAWAAHRLIRHYLRLSPAGVVALSACFTLALLGGGGGAQHYAWYPYDIPMACLFAWGLVGIEQRRWWTVLVVALAAYCKETAIFLVLLMLGYAYADPAHRARRLVEAAVAFVLFVVIQGYLAMAFFALPLQDAFTFPGRNTRLITWHFVFSSWFVLAFVALGARVATVWSQIPHGLRLAAMLVPCYLGSAFFKGWIEEWRQYTEIFLPVGLILVICIASDVAVLRDPKGKPRVGAVAA